MPLMNNIDMSKCVSACFESVEDKKSRHTLVQRDSFIHLSILQSIPVVLWLVRTFHFHTNVVGLGLGERGEFCANMLKVQAGNFLIEVFGQAVNANLVLFRP